VKHRARSAAMAIVVVGILGRDLSPAQGSTACRRRCGQQVAQCMLERGEVEGHYAMGACRRQVVAACRRRGAAACPLPSREELAASLAAVQALEAEVHDSPLCAATLPALPAETIDEAIAVGRELAAALAATADPSFQAHGTFRGGAFVKYFIALSVHSKAFWPLGDVVRELARPARLVAYSGDSGNPRVYGLVGSADGEALGVLLTVCP